MAIGRLEVRVDCRDDSDDDGMCVGVCETCRPKDERGGLQGSSLPTVDAVATAASSGRHHCGRRGDRLGDGGRGGGTVDVTRCPRWRTAHPVRRTRVGRTTA